MASLKKREKLCSLHSALTKTVTVSKLLSSAKYVSYQKIGQNILSRAKVSWVGCLRFHTLAPDCCVAVLSAREMQIKSDQWYHQRAAPASCLSVKHASRHICKQLTGPFPAALFLRGLEGWHADADLIVPRLSLNLHVRCQLACRHHSIAPNLTPNAAHALFKVVTSNLGKRRETVTEPKGYLNISIECAES